MKVLGHRVLIRPDAQQDETASGLALPTDRDWVATSGEVLQIGEGGPEWRFHARQKVLGDISALLSAELDLRARTGFEAGLRRAIELVISKLGTADPVSDLRIGDRVAFDAGSGVKVTVDNEPYLILTQDDVVVIVSESEAA